VYLSKNKYVLLYYLLDKVASEANTCVMLWYSQVRVSYIDAILGTEMKVATVDGDVDLKIAAGTQPETVTRLEGKGAPRYDTCM